MFRTYRIPRKLVTGVACKPTINATLCPGIEWHDPKTERNGRTVTKVSFLEYLRVRGPLNIAFGGRRYCLSVPGCRAVGATGARPREPLCLDLAGGVFSHVVAAGLDPDGVVHDTVHDRVGVNSGTESLMPIFLGVLGAEHR